MQYILFLIIIILMIVLSKAIYGVNYKKAKELNENKGMEKISNKFPDNIEIAKDMLEILHNKNVKIEQAKDTKTSLYIAVTNKIIIADFKENYARIQTIAHECIHSCQNKTLLLFNFIFSNIKLIYFAVIALLTAFNIINNGMIQVGILLLMSFVGFSVRSFLEIDAMTKARFLAEKYMDNKKLCTEEEKENLLSEYDKVNKMGIPFVIDNLLSTELIRIVIYIVICMTF